MLKLSSNNYLSVMKHRAKLLSMFKDSQMTEILGLNVGIKDNLFFSVFPNEETFKKAYLSFVRKPSLILWGGCIEKLSNYDSKSYELLNVTCENNEIEVSSIFSDIKINLSPFLYYSSINETLLDTSLLHNFSLNRKNCNNNSLLILLDKHNLFFIRRRNFLCVCGVAI